MHSNASRSISFACWVKGAYRDSESKLRTDFLDFLQPDSTPIIVKRCGVAAMITAGVLKRQSESHTLCFSADLECYQQPVSLFAPDRDEESLSNFSKKS